MIATQLFVLTYGYLFSYTLDLEQIKGTVSTETFKEPTQRKESKKVRTIVVIIGYGFDILEFANICAYFF